MHDGRVLAPHRVRNLRAAGRATITVRGRDEDVRATALDRTQRVDFFRDVLGPVARGIPFGVRFIRIVGGVDIDDPEEAADGRVVFELHRFDEAHEAGIGQRAPAPDVVPTATPDH